MGGKRKKTLLFLCKCGTNVANHVDLDELAQWAGDKGGLDCVECHNLLCSPGGKTFFKECLVKHGPENIVVAACSPKMHEKTFQELAEASGVNLSMVQMANIREQCGWVTSDKGEATAKAKLLVRAAALRAWEAEPLERRAMEVLTDILIIGGGIAGIEAALTASRAGRKVFVVDREISLGGEVIKTEEVAPNMECAPCLLAPRLTAVREDPNITVISNAEVTDLLGFYGNFTARIRRLPRFVKDNCIGCEACFEVCPVSVKSSFHLGMGTRKAIHTLFPGSVPAAAVIDRDNCLHFKDGSCDACVEACPFGSIDFEDTEETIEINVGAVIVATGLKPADVSAFPELGYGVHENVYTLPEFERLASSNGPTGGNIQLRDGKAPESIAVIHCAGSLRPDGVPYCSGTCCIGAAKVGELARKGLPGVKVVNFHQDLAFRGAGELKFLDHQKKEGTAFVRCDDLKEIKVSAGGAGINVSGPGFRPSEFDMVILSNGLVPSDGSANLAKTLNIDIDAAGFFTPDHPLLHETGSSLDGVYLAGSAAGPCDVATSVTRGVAAAGDAVSKLMPGRKIDLEILTSSIDEEVCGGCKLCISVCPYKGISYDSEKKVCVVNEAICRGCGTCTATCPSGASKARGFTDQQIYAEIGGLVHE